ncbi:hypothetical protein V5F38_05215 [Xanthobacter sp. V0B-10]|uniref:hypothetical protein n=1 Tax=Xanthobacter albus TaxID=3119929 RepID=UPI00372C7F22
MARPRGSKNKPKIVEAAGAPPAAGHNQLTEEQREALFFQHKKKYEQFLAAKKKADAELKNACKLAKSEVGDDAVERIKYAIELESEEGEARLKERIARQMEVARWMGLPVGAQSELFGDDRTPAEDKAYAEGKRAGMAGNERRPPNYDASSPQAQAWLRGYDAGQEVNRSLMADAIRPLSTVPEPTRDPFDDALDAAETEDA